VGFEVGGEEGFGVLVVLVGEGLVRGEKFGRDRLLRGREERGEKHGGEGGDADLGEGQKLLPTTSLPSGVAAEERS
jgi:hypothetical protein